MIDLTRIAKPVQTSGACKNPQTPKNLKSIKDAGVAKATKKSNKSLIKIENIPRQDSPKANDSRNYASSRTDQQDLSWQNLPDILYQIKPTKKTGPYLEPLLMRYLIHGHILQEIPVLSDNIVSDVKEFRVEAWMRLDSRSYLKDIIDRMHPDFNADGNSSILFGSAKMNMLAWDSNNKKSQETEVGLIEEMVNQGINP
ncbi:hypothetical protein EYZ11_003231 [Aspergillus tanneri]|uniref:Uncharacterized protein n=1 Tax=Aspergillus tanneri TaxID=1220188 RepID=A0A4S3JNS3_9EURO|nr:hypothetical protein EYZ11_003231 [Aspergillus tanneri]